MKSRSLFLIAMILTVLGTGPVLAQGKKGGGSTPPPPLPNVRYTLQSFKHPSFPALASETTYATYLTNGLMGLNNWGECVGSYGTPDGHQHAWYFRPQTMTQALDLNSIGVDVPSGYFLSGATGINDSGEIVGFMRKILAPTFRRGFVIELRPISGGLPVLHELPDNNDTWVDTYPRRINSQGEILGIFNDGLSTYLGWTAYLYNFKYPTIAPMVSDRKLAGRATHDLNNFGDVVATDSDGIGFLWDGTTTSLYPTRGISKINDYGTLCGASSQVVQVRKNVTGTSYFLFRDIGSGPVKIAGSDGKRGVDAFNNSGTILCDRRFIFQDAWGFIDISKLLTGPIGSWTGGFGSGAEMNDVGPAGFGQIAGIAGRTTVGEQPTYLLLTPYALP